MQTIRRPSFVALLLASVAAGCAATSANPTREFLDTVTGVTITSSKAPVVLYRDDPSRAAYARDFIHLGPIEVNRSGQHRYFLWAGIWSTLQTPDRATERSDFESVTIFVDGEPLNLANAGWTPESIGASEPVYLKPVASATDAYYPVTVDQIRFMAQAHDLRLRTAGPAATEYALWDDQRQASKRLQSFLASVGFAD